MDSYRTYLQAQGEELLEAIRQCEMEGWHHSSAESAHFQHYLRLGTWLATVVQRMVWYDNTGANREKRQREASYLRSPSPTSVARYILQRLDRKRLGADRELTGEHLTGGHPRFDSDADSDPSEFPGSDPGGGDRVADC